MKGRLQIIFLLPFFVLTLCFAKELAAQSNDLKSEKKLEVGEELVYLVKYSVMRLGEIKLKISEAKRIKGKLYYKATADINSYPSVPFVDLHQVYETKMTPDYYSSYFKGIIKRSDDTSYSEYKFDYEHSLVMIKERNSHKSVPEFDTTISIDKKYQDGLSLFYYARINSGQDKKDEIPTFIDKKKATTDIYFENHGEDVSIDAVDYDVDCVHLEGEAHFISIFGLNGDFEGWFSNDEAAVPIKAKMKVFIGNITLELKSWKRNGWEPPKYKD